METNNSNVAIKKLTLEERLNQIEILLNNKNTREELSVWQPTAQTASMLQVDDRFYERLDTDLKDMRDKLQEFIDVTANNVMNNEISNNPNQFDNSVLLASQYKYASCILNELELQKKSLEGLQNNIQKVNDFLNESKVNQSKIIQLVEEDVDKQVISSVNKKMTSLSTDTSNIVKTVNKMNDNLIDLPAESKKWEEKLHVITKKTDSINNLEKLLNEVNETLIQTKKLLDSTSDDVKIITKQWTSKQQNNDDYIKELEKYKQDCYNIARLIFNQWDEHAAEYRKLDNVAFSDNERKRLTKTVSDKIDVHIEIMNYFITLVFKIKSILEKGA